MDKQAICINTGQQKLKIHSLLYFLIFQTKQFFTNDKNETNKIFA